ncbi:VanZ family protein [Paraflavisolibacter sp. H34]|uniref:VanZ family protein n=1 Tax=Huijunlia imazamoxiresistens TaxID=3127457 RepID=UPI00301A3DC9
MNSNAASRLSVLLFVIYLLVLCKLILFKGSFGDLYQHFSQHYGGAAIRKTWAHANLVPTSRIRYYLRGEEPLEPAVQNLAGNILLFVPFGFLLPWIHARLAAYRKVFVAAALASLSLELLQLALACGDFDVDDLLLNTLGALLGYGCFVLLPTSPDFQKT